VSDDSWQWRSSPIPKLEEIIGEFPPKMQYTHEGVKAPFSAIGFNRDTQLLWLGTPAVSVACIN